MTIAACIVLYYPNPALFKENVLAIKDNVSQVIFWQNFSPLSLPDIHSSIHNSVILGDGSNQLISRPLNKCLQYCHERRIDYLLTMDQDSVFEDFPRFIELVKKYQNDTIIAYTPNINGCYSIRQDKQCIPIEFSFTSGSLCNVEACLAIGGFREDYGIDWVDAEFCHRAKLKGYSIVSFPSCKLQHQLGGNYGPFRYYHIFRNMLWMHKEYPDNPNIKTILHTYRYNFRTILKEKRAIANFIAVLRGSLVGVFSPVRKKLIG